MVPIEGPLSGLALSSDGKILATRQPAKHEMLLMDVATGKTVGAKTYDEDYSESNISLAFGTTGNGQPNVLGITNVRVGFYSVPSLDQLNYLSNVYASRIAWARISTEPVVALRPFDYGKDNLIGTWPIRRLTPEIVPS